MSVAAKTLLTGGVGIASSLLWLGVDAFVSRQLGASGRGELSALTAAVALLATVGGLGLVDGIVYHFKTRRAPLTGLLACAAGWAAAFTLLAILASRLPGDAWAWGRLDGTTALLGIILYTSLTTASLEPLLIVDGAMWLHTAKEFARPALHLFVVYLLSRGGLSVAEALGGTASASLVPLLCLLIWSRRHRASALGTPAASLFLDLVRMGAKPWGISLLVTVPKRLDVILLALFRGPVEAGFYAIAMGGLTLALGLAKAAMWPLVGRLADSDGGERGRSTARASRLLLGAMTLLAIPAALAAPAGASLIYGPEFSEAGRVFSLMTLVLPATALVVPGNAFFTSGGNPGRILPFLGMLQFMHLTLSVILIPELGHFGAALALCANHVLLAAATVALLARETRLPAREFIVPTPRDLLELARSASDGLGARRHIRT